MRRQLRAIKANQPHQLLVRCRPARRLAAIAVFALGVLVARVAQAQVVEVPADDAALRVQYEKGTRVVLFYSATCPASRQMFPSFVALARRYAPVGVTFLAFALDDDPEVLDAYLGTGILPFDRQYIRRAPAGVLSAAFRPTGLHVPRAAYTPSIAVIAGNGRIVGERVGIDGVLLTDGWLHRLGFRPE